MEGALAKETQLPKNDERRHHIIIRRDLLWKHVYNVYMYVYILNNVYTVCIIYKYNIGVFCDLVPKIGAWPFPEAPNYIIDLCCEQLKADGRALATNSHRSQALMDRSSGRFL